MNAIKNITIGHTERLYKPVGYTMLANLVNIVPFCLSIEAIRIIFNAFDGSGQPLDTPRLWWIFGIMVVYMLVMALAERASYRANFREAYEMSASGRIVACRASAETFTGISVKTRPRRFIFHAYYGLYDGRNRNFAPPTPTDGRCGHARTGFCLAGLD